MPCPARRRFGPSVNVFTRGWRMPVSRRWDFSPFRLPWAPSRRSLGRFSWKVKPITARARSVNSYLFHNRPNVGAAYEPVSQHLLPLDEKWRLRLAHLPWPTRNLPEVVGCQEQTLRALVREYLFVSLFKACAESLASENASRLAAMQRAEKNIDDLVGNLNQTFRRLRQTSIDEELFDVLSGYESLSRGKSR